MRFWYHDRCFVGNADPRTQTGSTFNSDDYKDFDFSAAPLDKGRGKWSVKEYGYQPKSMGYHEAPTILQPNITVASSKGQLAAPPNGRGARTRSKSTNPHPHQHSALPRVAGMLKYAVERSPASEALVQARRANISKERAAEANALS